MRARRGRVCPDLGCCAVGAVVDVPWAHAQESAGVVDAVVIVPWAHARESAGVVDAVDGHAVGVSVPVVTARRRASERWESEIMSA